MADGNCEVDVDDSLDDIESSAMAGDGIVVFKARGPSSTRHVK